MKAITVQELKQLQDSGADFQLIDVREPSEYQEANLGGDLIPLGAILDDESKVAKGKKVVVHCRSGKRSATAILQLETSYGHDELYNLTGGIIAYIDEFGLPS